MSRRHKSGILFGPSLSMAQSYPLTSHGRILKTRRERESRSSDVIKSLFSTLKSCGSHSHRDKSTRTSPSRHGWDLLSLLPTPPPPYPPPEKKLCDIILNERKSELHQIQFRPSPESFVEPAATYTEDCSWMAGCYCCYYYYYTGAIYIFRTLEEDRKDLPFLSDSKLEQEKSGRRDVDRCCKW